MFNQWGVAMHVTLQITMRFFRTTLMVVAAFSVSACTATPQSSAPAGSLQGQTEALANQLFARSGIQGQVAVGSLVPIDTLRQQGNGRERIMARQIQEGLISAATQRGVQVTEYRTSTQLRLEDEQELMLSRDVADLSNRQQLDYFLTGTFSEVDGGLLVNVRLIRLNSNNVHAAASEFFPWSSIEGDGLQTELRHGQLYRHGGYTR